MVAKKRPGTGDKRKTEQPLKIDRLPEPIREAITYLRNRRGKTWLEIEEQSALPYNKDWETKGGGFVEWETLDTAILELFPDLRLPKSTLQRWYDIRVAQVRQQVLVEAEASRAFAEKFAGASIENGNEAVINAMRDEVFALSRSLDDGSRGQFLAQLNKLTLAMQRIQRLDLQRKQTEAAIAKSETDRARIAAQSGDPREVYLQAVSALLKSLRTRDEVRRVIDPIKDELIQEMSNAAESFARQVQANAA